MVRSQWIQSACLELVEFALRREGFLNNLEENICGKKSRVSMEESDLSICISTNVRRLPRKRVMAKVSDLGLFPSGANKNVSIYEAPPPGFPCFVDIPYRGLSAQKFKMKKAVFLKGRPDKILFSDRLDSGLVRFNSTQNVLANSETRFSRSKLLYGDKDFRAWLELELPPPGKDRLPKTKVLIAAHYFFWKAKDSRDDELGSSLLALLRWLVFLKLGLGAAAGR